ILRRWSHCRCGVGPSCWYTGCILMFLLRGCFPALPAGLTAPGGCVLESLRGDQDVRQRSSGCLEPRQWCLRADSSIGCLPTAVSTAPPRGHCISLHRRSGELLSGAGEIRLVRLCPVCMTVVGLAANQKRAYGIALPPATCVVHTRGPASLSAHG